ncbi:MAG TPA: dihydrodipicolinate synthase family protein [Terriglobales bacterium]|nr:dihydrodipicolinate synthase family protein [Terriglobales bacterium]
MLLQGIIPPITTPFYPDGRVYYKKLEHNVEHYSKTPVAGIVVLGSTGETVMLSDEERQQVLKTASQACAAHKVLIAGTGAESAIETLKLTEYAAQFGYDVALVRTPFYFRNRMPKEGMLAFYRTVADQSPIPVMIYSVPVFTGYDIPAELVIELAEHPNIIGIKESGGDVEKVRRMAEGTRHIRRQATVTDTFVAVTPRMLKKAQGEATNFKDELIPVGALAGVSTEHVGTGAQARPQEQDSAAKSSSSSITTIGKVRTRQKEVGFQVSVGAAQKLHPSLEAGAIGGILAFADPAPTACYEIYAAWKEGDQELALIKQERITRAAIRVGAELGIPALKYAMDVNGYYGGVPRVPLLPMTAELKLEVEQLMADIRN